VGVGVGAAAAGDGGGVGVATAGDGGCGAAAAAGNGGCGGRWRLQRPVTAGGCSGR
jgi:hypothetical protein